MWYPRLPKESKISMEMETTRTEPELDLQPWCIQNVLKVIVEANDFKHQNLIDALSSMGYSNWQPRWPSAGGRKRYWPPTL